MRKSLNFIHKDNYGEAMKVAKKFTDKGTFRPILQFVLHDKNKSIYATDSHRAIQIKDIHGFDKDYLVHPNTLEFATGNYPEIDDKINFSGGEKVITLTKEQIGIWLQMHRSLNQVIRQSYKGREHVSIEFKENIQLKINGENEITINLPYEEYHRKEDVDVISYNVTYMRDCLEAHAKLGSNHVDLIIKSKMRPIAIDNGDNVRCLLLPVRIY